MSSFDVRRRHHERRGTVALIPKHMVLRGEGLYRGGNSSSCCSRSRLHMGSRKLVGNLIIRKAAHQPAAVDHGCEAKERRAKERGAKEQLRGGEDFGSASLWVELCGPFAGRSPR